MSLASTLAVSLQGISGNVVTVEVDIADGIPSYTLLGLPDTALSESRDRIRAALVNCGEVWPHRKVTVSLSPAWLPKSGSSFDQVSNEVSNRSISRFGLFPAILSTISINVTAAKNMLRVTNAPR